MRTLKQALQVRDSVFDASRRDTVLNLVHLVEGKIKPAEFFEENFVTDGMAVLLKEALRRLAGKSSQAVFKLTQALDQARRDRSLRAVHIVAHGEKSRRRSSLILTGGERIDLARDGKRLFRQLRTEVIFLSCCQLGQDPELMRSILTSSRAHAIFSYTDDVNDYQSFITESLFYHLAYGYFHGRESSLELREVYERLKFALHFLGIDNVRDSLVDPLLAADFSDEL